MTAPFDAGLPKLPGASPYRLGEVKYFTGGAIPRLVDADGGEWLRTGYLYPYSGKYAQLLKEIPGACVAALPGRFTTFTQPSYGYNGKFFYISANYVFLGGGTSGNWLDAKYAGTLTFGATIGSLGSYLSGIYGAFAVGTTLVAFGAQQSGTPGAGRSLNLAAFGQPTGLPIDTTYFPGGSNGTNLAVLVNNSNNAANSNGLYTSTDGNTFTNRTGTGGTNGTIHAINWMPCASKFAFQVAPTAGIVSALNTTADGFTQAAVTLPAAVNFVANDTWDKRYAASPTASLWLLPDGRILRTTDGVNFAAINPSDTNGLLCTSAYAQMIYDPATSRFIIATGAGGTSGFPTFVYSDDNGLSWNTSIAFEDLEFTASNYWGRFTTIGAVNGKFIGWATVTNSGTPSREFDMTGINMRAPSCIGTYLSGYQAANGALTVYQHLKVK